MFDNQTKAKTKVNKVNAPVAENTQNIYIRSSFCSNNSKRLNNAINAQQDCNWNELSKHIALKPHPHHIFHKELEVILSNY